MGGEWKPSGQSGDDGGGLTVETEKGADPWGILDGEWM